MTNGGSGDLRVLVPLGTGVQVQVERQGSGTVRVPEAVAKQTTPTGQLWESRSYANAAQKVSIRVQSQGSGDIIVEYR